MPTSTTRTRPADKAASPPRATAAAPKAQRQQLTAQDWIGAAKELLVHRSVDAVRVDVLAKTLAVTRGSFYWHFADREDLLKRVLLSWQEEQTEQIIQRYRRQGAQAEVLVAELAGLPFHGRAALRGSSVELAIRAWARRDEMARQVVDTVDAKRLQYLQECFSSLGFSGPDAKARAFLLYCYMQSESLLHNQGSAAEKAQRQQFVARLLVDRLGSEVAAGS